MPSTPDSKAKRLGYASVSVLLLGLLWQALAAAVDAEIVLPGPGSVLEASLRIYAEAHFAEALGGTFLRGMSAFALSCVFGIACGAASGLSPGFKALMAPLMTILRATPVLAIILITLLWFPAGFVPVFSAFLMAFPVMASASEAGLSCTDGKLVEAMRLFGMDRGALFRHVYLPSALPSIIGGARSSIGLSWKVVVAGEVLSQPAMAIGTGMQNARSIAEMPEVLAWAIAAILLCGLTEAAFAFFERRLARAHI